MNQRLKGVLYTLAAGLIYGFTPILCAITYQNGNDALSMTFFRNLLILPFLAWMLYKDKISLRLEGGKVLPVLLTALFGTLLTTLLLYGSYVYIGVGTATSLHFFYPVLVTLVCLWIYHDRIEAKQWQALLLGTVGVLILIDPSSKANLIGIALALGSACTFSLYLVIIEKKRLSRLPGPLLAFWLCMFVSVVLAIQSLFLVPIVWVQPLGNYLLMLVVSFLVAFVALSFLQKGIGILGSSQAALFSLSEPLSSIVFGILFLKEEFSLVKLAGCVLILGGVLLLAKKKT
ncbi:MAG: DMT family transporter [Erysipelotrichaceae bacterium]|jgi:drug/metabolite transporter (DMT)-like permease|nr:DMT family transporter [Erysipelotrichaceae bacterium]